MAVMLVHTERKKLAYAIGRAKDNIVREINCNLIVKSLDVFHFQVV